MARLKKNGLIVEKGIEQDGGPEKLIYAITPAGQEKLRAWFATPVKMAHQQDEFFLKLMLSLATGEVDPRKVIYAQRASLYQGLYTITAQRGNADSESELAQTLLLDQAIMHLEADLRWLEMIEARLDEIARQPLPEPKARPRGRPPKGK